MVGLSGGLGLTWWDFKALWRSPHFLGIDSVAIMYLCIARRMVLTGSHAAMKLCLSHVVISQPSVVGKSVLECVYFDPIVLTL